MTQPLKFSLDHLLSFLGCLLKCAPLIVSFSIHSKELFELEAHIKHDEIILYVRNQSGRDARVNGIFSLFSVREHGARKNGYSLLILDRHRKCYMPLFAHIHRRRKVELEDFVLLKPGAFYGRKILISDLVRKHVLYPGEYQVKVFYSSYLRSKKVDKLFIESDWFDLTIDEDSGVDKKNFSKTYKFFENNEGSTQKRAFKYKNYPSCVIPRRSLNINK